MTWVLKILAGKHAGAEMDIEGSHLIIGACSEQSDCVISDAGLASKAMQLTLTDSLLAVKELNNKDWYINGRRQRENLQRLQPYDVIQLGTIAFTIGEGGVGWPAIRIPVPKKKQTLWLGALLSALLCIGSLNTFWVQERVAYASDHQEQLEAPVPMNYPGLVITNEGQRILVTGYVLDLATSRQARTQVENRYPLPVTWKAYRQDKLEAAITTWLTEHNLNGYQVAVDQQGLATIRGVMQDGIATAPLSASIRSDVPGIKEVRFNVYRVREVIKWLNQEAFKLGMVHVGSSSYKAEILLTGLADAKQRRQIAALLDTAKERFGSQIPMSYRRFVEPDGMVPHLKAVSTSVTPYVELVSGNKYLEESVIGDGFTIEKITDEGIALSKGGQRIWIAAGG